jgi:hypothetical protein
MARWLGFYATGSDSKRRSFARDKIEICMQGGWNFRDNCHRSVINVAALSWVLCRAGIYSAADNYGDTPLALIVMPARAGTQAAARVPARAAMTM